MERVRRLAGHRVSEGQSLSAPPPLTGERARAWARYAETSPLYQHLTEVIADEPRLLEVLNAMEHLPRHNVLFAGVQYLMMRDGGGELAAFYPNFAATPRKLEGVDIPFTEFVLDHLAELLEIGRTRYTQTNECRRCSALLPAIWATGVRRFHLVDFGTSAGLNLHLDRYRYRWGDTEWGPDSAVELETEMRGIDVLPSEIEVLSRTGLDLNPIDPGDPDDRRWLEALVWPEHHRRRHRLIAALDLAAAYQVGRVAGDGLTRLPQVLNELPGNDPAVVVNSFILNQFSSEDRERYEQILVEAREDRPIYRVSMEWLDPSTDAADLEIDDGSGLRQIGRGQPHGEWLELYARP